MYIHVYIHDLENSTTWIKIGYCAIIDTIDYVNVVYRIYGAGSVYACKKLLYFDIIFIDNIYYR